MDLNQYKADADSVGNCNGQEEVVAENLNRIYAALELRLYPLFVTGMEGHYNPDKYEEIMDNVKSDWSGRENELATLTDEQIQAYVDKVCESTTVQSSTEGESATYSISELESQAAGIKQKATAPGEVIDLQTEDIKQKSNQNI